MDTKAPALSYATGETSEAEEAKRRYQEAQKLLLDALEARKNRLFDPTLLAIAEGFGAPTRSGSFFEGLGRVAGKLRESQTQQEAEEKKIAEMRLNLAQQGLSMEQQKERERFLRGMMPPSQAPEPPAPTGGAPAAPATLGSPAQAPAGMPTGVAPQAAQAAQAALGDKPPGTEGVEGIPIMPPNREIADRRAVLAAAIREPGRSTFEVVKELQELERKRYKEHPEGMVDLATGLLYRIRKPIDVAPVTIQLRTIPGLQNQTLTVPSDVAKQWTEALNEAIKSGNADRLRDLERKITSTFTESPAKPAEERSSTPAVEAAVRQAAGAPIPGRIATAEEMATSAAAQKEVAMISAKDKATRTSVMMQNAETASNNLPLVEQVRAFGEKPSAPKIMGAFTNPNILSQVVRLAETGISGPGFSIGIPAVRDVANNLKLTAEEQRDFQLFGQLLVRLQMGITAAERGPGAVSNFERELFSKSKITQDDLPQTVMAKVNGMGRMYKYQTDLADRLQASGMQYDDYIRTPEGRALYRQYLTDLQAIVENLPSGRRPVRRPSNAASPDRKAVDDLLRGR